MSLVKRFTLLTSLLVCSNVFAQSAVQVQFDEDLLSVQADNAPARDLADELARELGIRVVIMGDAQTRVSLDIFEEPMEKALAKLSPNNMLMHSADASDITGVVLMMGSSSTGVSGAGPDSFLPSGSPVDAVIEDQPADFPQEQQELEFQESENIDPNDLRDPARSAQVREAAQAASSDANLPAQQLPPMYAEEQLDDAVIDPETGLPYQQ